MKKLFTVTAIGLALLTWHTSCTLQPKACLLYTSSTMRKLQSANILAALEAHPAFRAANTVLLYHSLNDEVDTHASVSYTHLDVYKRQK